VDRNKYSKVQSNHQNDFSAKAGMDASIGIGNIGKQNEHVPMLLGDYIKHLNNKKVY
jgi:hypothetical protein